MPTPTENCQSHLGINLKRNTEKPTLEVIALTPTAPTSAPTGALLPQTCWVDWISRAHERAFKPETNLDITQKLWQARQAGPPERMDQLSQFIVLSIPSRPNPFFEFYHSIRKFCKGGESDGNEGRERFLDEGIQLLACGDKEFE